MIPKPTQYLLRFDDICPTMSHSGWDRFRPMIEEYNIRPILAVVPDNRDPELVVSLTDPKFWERMRSMETAGATIAVHGYQHLCKSRGKSLLGLHRETEFAGICKEQQREWVRAGLRILRGQGLNPRLWVAPRHGFDENTLHALREEGIEFISDGLARRPLSRGGVTWIPQQLWEPMQREKGLWTICIHSNTANGWEVERLRRFIAAHRNQFTSFERVVTEYEPTALDFRERVYEAGAMIRMRLASIEKVWLGKDTKN